MIQVLTVVFIIFLTLVGAEDQRRRAIRRRADQEIGEILGNIVSILKETEEEFIGKCLKIDNHISSNGGKICTKEIYDLTQSIVKRDRLGRLDCTEELKTALREFKTKHTNVFTKEELELDDLR